MKPLVRGEETDLIEIPASWYLDDLPPMMFIKAAPNSHGFVSPRDLEQLWLDQFDWVYREFDYAVFTMTIHPDVSGRPQVLLMHERIIDHINKHDGRALGDLRRDRRRLREAEPARLEVSARAATSCRSPRSGRRARACPSRSGARRRRRPRRPGGSRSGRGSRAPSRRTATVAARTGGRHVRPPLREIVHE